MATTAPSLADIALQLETATAQLRVLSAFPEAQQNGKVQEIVNEVKNSVEDVKTKMQAMEEQIKKHTSEMKSLRDTTNKRLLALEAAYVAFFL